MDKRVPEVRFKGFTDDWEQRKASELFSSISKKGYESLPVLSVTQENGVMKRENINIDIKYDKSTLSNYKLIVPGNFVISLRSFQGGFELSNIKGIVSPAYTVFTFDNENNHNKLFWKEKFKTYKFIQSLKTITFGIRDGKSISFSEFKSLRLNYPDNYLEQKRIGNLLELLESTVDLQQRKYSLIKLQKEFLMQNMFPAKSNSEPKIRFNNFDESWSRKRLGDYLKIPDKVKVDVKDTKEIMTLKLNLGGIRTDSSRKTLSLGSTTYYKRKSGQFLYGKQNFFNGSMAIIPNKFDGKVTSGDVPALNIVGIDSFYLYQYVSRHDYWKKAEGMATGTGSKRIHESTLQKLPITVPNKKEQELIGMTLNKCNEFIKVQ